MAAEVPGTCGDGEEVEAGSHKVRDRGVAQGIGRRGWRQVSGNNPFLDRPPPRGSVLRRPIRRANSGAAGSLLLPCSFITAAVLGGSRILRPLPVLSFRMTNPPSVG